MPSSAKPIVLLPLCLRQGKHQLEYFTTRKNIEAIHRLGLIPLPVPSLLKEDEIRDLLCFSCAHIAGVMLTGSRTNVNPTRYGDELTAYDRAHMDGDRDALVFTLIQCCFEMGVPLLAICRGIQEVNVAFGGTLYRVTDEDYSHAEHRQRQDVSWDESFSATHHVRTRAGGLLASILGSEHRFAVNSLHEQGIEKLAPNLITEAVADDGLIEAVSHRHAKDFFLGLQWHPEHPKVSQTEENRRIWDAFRMSVRAYQQRQLNRVAAPASAASRAASHA